MIPSLGTKLITSQTGSDEDEIESEDGGINLTVSIDVNELRQG